MIQKLPSIPLWISFSCKVRTKNCFAKVLPYDTFFVKDERRTCYGDEFSDVVSKLCLNPKISALGINCTHPNYISALLKSAQFGLKPFVVYPNSGEDWTREKG